ncbi:GntR family transcriptional regulator [Streptomyces anulatus]|uniref:GntR family transcriptional regulator n=1 Tax=Streptomyces anulatus TaxID=1892 RepID=UPI00364C03FF
MVSAVVRVLRDEGLVTLHGPGVRAAVPNVPAPGGTHTVADPIAETVRKRLADHTYPPGQRLPPNRLLAVEFDTSLTTARLALLQLTLEGLLRPWQPYETPGTYATDPVREAREALLLADLQASMRRGGWTRAEYSDAVERALHALIGSVGRPKAGGGP